MQNLSQKTASKEVGHINLRDVLFLVHAKPRDKKQEDLWKRLINDELKTPDTWEVELSASKDKKASWTRLLQENKLGALALLRNLRNFTQCGVDEKLVRQALSNIRTERVLPFRFISAARHAPKFEAELESAMLKCLEAQEKLAGKTVVLVDVSGSMSSKVSGKSEISRLDAACGVAMMAREMCEAVEVYSFSERHVFVAPRRGFALAEAIKTSQGHGGTFLGAAVTYVNSLDADRLIVVTDEQSADRVPAPKMKKAYMINVAPYQNGVGYNNGWTNISGWSESIVNYIVEKEKSE